MNGPMEEPCRICGKVDLFKIIDFGPQPIAHRLQTDPSAQEYLHHVSLRLCEACGLFQLTDPIPPDVLYTDYNWLSSWKWNPHIPRSVQLIDQMAGLNKSSRIVEVASNDGSFLEVLQQHGYQNVLGVEPAQDAVKVARAKGVETLASYFNPEVARDMVSADGKCDLLIAREVLEHVNELPAFREAMSILLRPGGYALIEVPNFDFTLKTTDYSAIWEEHVNHFTLETLSRFLAEAEIRVIHSESATFSGEVLIVVGKYLGTPLQLANNGYLEELRTKAITFRDRWPKFCQAFLDSLRQHSVDGGRAAIYGAGCRACSLINFVGLSPYIDFIADDQPEKQGKYMPGSGLPILPGEALEQQSAELCLLAVNAESEEKVIAQHQGFLQRGGRFASILPPSDRLLRIWDWS